MMPGGMLRMQYSESTLLVWLAEQAHIPSCGRIARGYHGLDQRESAAQRGKILHFLWRLEARGYIERPASKRWHGTTLTTMGRAIATFEKLAPPTPRRPHRKVRHSHPNIAAGHTLYPKQVLSDFDTLRVLKRGDNNMKLGGTVRKGHLRGYHIYSLALEERATCPRACERWNDCYGNQMGLQQRMAPGPALEAKIRAELDELMNQRIPGVLLRLHVLGDFYSTDYVHFWCVMLATYPRLTIFGYTARDRVDPIGKDVRWLARSQDRFRMRYSGTTGPMGATWYIPGQDPPPDTFACPEQLELTPSCADCAACWEGTKAVAFKLH